MFIIPIIPVLFANRLLADWTSHFGCSACPLSHIWRQFNRWLLSIAHPTVSCRFQSKIHLLTRTLVRLHPRSALVIHSDLLLLCRVMCDAAGDTIETEKTLIAVAWQDWGLLHPACFFYLPSQSHSMALVSSDMTRLIWKSCLPNSFFKYLLHSLSLIPELAR